MSNDTMSERERAVLDVIREFVLNLGVEPTTFNPDVDLRSLGVDSLQAVDLIFQFEERLGVAIPIEEFQAATVREAVTFVAALPFQRD